MVLEANGVRMWDAWNGHVWLKDKDTGIAVTMQCDEDLTEDEALKMIDMFRDTVKRGLLDREDDW